MSISWKVDRRERNVAQETSRCANIQSPHADVFERAGQTGGVVELHSDFDDLERVREEHLAAAGDAASDDLERQRHDVVFSEHVAHQIVDGQLDRLFGADAEALRRNPVVQSAES